ncbi:MAG: Hsp70 family protein [Acidobacteria bacterium]|nr:Hsp70 family protein [Acidobacteriota bacterium]
MAVVALGAGAILLAPARLPGPQPANPWLAPGETDRGAVPPAAGGPGAAGVPGGTRDLPLPVLRPAVLVVEQVSPIVGPDSILAESLGIETAGGTFTPILPKGTRAPVMRYVTFKTSADDQKEIRLHVLRGGSDRVAGNHDLGWVRVADLPPGPKGAVQVTVGFRIADGAIVLAAADPVTRRAYTIEPSEAPPGFPR